MSASDSDPKSQQPKPSGKSSSDPKQSAKPKANWRGKDQAGAAKPRYRWQEHAAGDEDPGLLRKKFWYRVRFGMMSVLSLALIGLFIYIIITRAPKSPFLGVALTGYPAPVSLNAWAQEDVEGFGDLDAETLNYVNMSRDWASKEQALESLDQKLLAAKSAAIKAKVIIVYLSAHGVTDKDGDPCLLFPNASPLESPSWLPLNDVLKRFANAKLPDTVNKLLILDSSRMDTNWHMGVLYNSFSAHLEKAVDRAGVTGLVVLNSTGPGEVGWSSPELQGSVFGHFVLEGIAGAADRKNDTGNSDQKVSLHELDGYLKHRVAQWVRENRADVQVPMLVPASAADFTVAYAGGSGRVGRSAKRVAPAPREKEKAAEPAAERQPSSVLDPEIATLWERLDELQPQQVYRLDPVAWQYFVQRLVRLEQLVLAGKAYEGEAQKTLDELKGRLNRLGTARSTPGTLAAFSLPLADMLHRFKETPEARRKLRAEYARADASYKPATPVSYLARADAAWNRFVKEPTRELAAQLTAFVGNPDLDIEPGVVEAHFLKMLDRQLDSETWKEPTRELIERAVSTRDLAEKLSVPADERVQYWLRDRLDRAADSRRRADDGLFVGSALALENSRTLYAEAGKQLEAAKDVAARVEEALRLRDQAWAELPFLAEWVTRNPALGQSDSDSDYQVNDRLLPLLRNMSELAANLDQALDADSPDPAVFSGRFKELKRGLKELEDLFHDKCENLRRAGADQTALREITAALAVPLMPWVERQALRERSRSIALDLHKKFPSTAVGSSQAGSKGKTAGAATASEAAEKLGETRLERVTVLWDEHPTLAILSRDFLQAGANAKIEEKKSLPAGAGLTDKLRRADVQGGVVRDLLSSVPQKSLDWLEDSAQKLAKLSGGKEALIQTRIGRSRAERLVRAAAMLRADQPDPEPDHDPILQLRSLDLHNLLTWHCQRTLDDFWGPADSAAPEESSFFIKAAENYLESAKGLCRTAGGQRPKQDEALVELWRTRRDAATHWATLDANSISPGEEDDEPEIPHSLVVTFDQNIPSGTVAVFLQNSGETLLPLRNTDRVGNLRRMMMPAGAAEIAAAQRRDYLVGRADLETGGSRLMAVALYRGHSRVFDVPVTQPGGVKLLHTLPENPPTFVTVSGQSKERGAVVLILDCSGSMSDPVAVGVAGGAPQSKFVAATLAFKDLLTRLAEGKRYRVGVRFYGHRVGYTPPPAVGLVPRNNPNWKQPIPVIRPGEDVELVKPLGFFGEQDLADVFERLNMLQPWGVTPLYLSIGDALKSDFKDVAKEIPRSIVVITDGENNQQTDDTGLKRASIRTLADVLAEIAAHEGIRINLIGFNLPKAEAQRALAAFNQITEKSGGKFYPAGNSLELAQALEKLIPNKYVVSRADSTQPAPADIKDTDIDRRTPITLPPAKRKQNFPFVAQLRTVDQEVKAQFELEGGESIQLAISDDGGRLEHRLYNERLEVFVPPPKTRQGLLDPSDAQRQFRIGVHRPERQGTTMRFPISIQNADAKSFSPRPAEAWVDITPVLGGEPDPNKVYSFYDMTFEEGRPVPMLSCAAPEWPSEAKEAQIKLWFKMRATEPDKRAKVGDVANKQGGVGGIPQLAVSSLPGVTFGVQVKRGKNQGDPFRVIVTERHPTADPNFHSLKVELDPPAKKTSRRFDLERNHCVHTFYLPDLPEAEILNDYELRITTRKSLEKDAVRLDEPIKLKLLEPDPTLRN